MAEMKQVVYQCSWCGKIVTRSERIGRPDPGKCPRKAGDKPHSWVIKRKC